MFSFTIMFLFIIAVGNYIIGKKDVLYPAFLYSLLWVIIFICYTAAPIEINIISDKTCFVLMAGVLFFSIGCTLSKTLAYLRKYAPLNCKTNLFASCPTTYKKSYLGKYILTIYSLLIVPFFLRDILAASGGTISFFELNKALALAALADTRIFSSVFTGSMVFISIDIAFIYFIEYPKEKKLTLLSIAVSLFYCFFATGRTYLLSLIVGLVAIYFIKKSDKLYFYDFAKKTFIPSFFLIIFMMMYMFMTHTTEDGGLLDMGVKYFFAYLIGPIAGLDLIVNSEQFDLPIHTFQFFSNISNSLFDTNIPLPPRLDRFENIPFPINVFTVYKYFIQDFGFFGLCIVFTTIGFIHGVIYANARAGRRFWIYLYALSLYPLAMTFFDDVYANIRGGVRDLIVAILYYYVFRFCIKSLIHFSGLLKKHDFGANHDKPSNCNNYLPNKIQ